MKRHDVPSKIWRKPLRIAAKVIRKWRSFTEWIVQSDRKCQMKRCGTNVWINSGTVLDGLERMSFGNHVYIGPNCLFYSTDADLTIGDYVTFGPHVTIVTGDHRVDEVGQLIAKSHKQGAEPGAYDAPVSIDADVWVGANATILKVVKIARGSVIGAGAVVTKSTEPYGIYAGVPAKRVGVRFPEEVQQEHERIVQEQYPDVFGEGRYV